MEACVNAEIGSRGKKILFIPGNFRTLIATDPAIAGETVRSKGIILILL